MTEHITPPELEERFREPAGWRWHYFEREKGRKLRFGTISPKDSIPDAVVVCVHGVREFSEKYYETARWCIDNNLAFWTFDWLGQGKSTRYLKDTNKRHARSFDEDVADLHAFILGYIKHSSVHPDKGRIPLALLGHSMGANIGMHYLVKHPDIFECAAFTAPMIGIKAFDSIPQKLALNFTNILSEFAGKSYVPGGNSFIKRKEKARLTSDPDRAKIHNFWCEHEPELQCGDVTLKWLYEAQKSCIALQKDAHLINKPSLFAIPAHEDLVDNALAYQTIKKINHAKIIEYPDAAHEILMEKDHIRNDFLNQFYALIKENIINRPETLKPF